MKANLSITLDERHAAVLQRLSEREHRSVSSQVERIVEEWLRDHADQEGIPTTPGRFIGVVSREECHGDD